MSIPEPVWPKSNYPPGRVSNFYAIVAIPILCPPPIPLSPPPAPAGPTAAGLPGEAARCLAAAAFCHVAAIHAAGPVAFCTVDRLTHRLLFRPAAPEAVLPLAGGRWARLRAVDAAARRRATASAPAVGGMGMPLPPFLGRGESFGGVLGGGRTGGGQRVQCEGGHGADMAISGAKLGPKACLEHKFR